MVFLVLAGVLVVMTAGGGLFWAHRRTVARREAVARQRFEAQANRIDGVAGNPDLGLRDEAARVAAVLERWGDSLRRQDRRTLATLFDAGRLRTEMRAKGLIRTIAGDDAALAKSLAQTLTDDSPLGWARHELRLIRFRDGGTEVDVALDLWEQAPATEPSRMRVRLTRSRGEWRVYDYEFVSGVATSVVSGVMNARKEVPRQAWVASVGPYEELIAAWQIGNWDRMDKALATLERTQSSLPASLGAVCHRLRGDRLRMQDKAADAVKEFDASLRLDPDSPEARLLRMIALNDVGRHDDALADGAAYRRLVGPGSGVFNQTGYALQSLNRDAEALQAFRDALAEDPDTIGSLQGLGFLLPAEGVGELTAALRRTKRPEEYLRPLARAYYNAGRPAALDAVNAAWKELRPADPWRGLHAAQSLYLRKWFGEAADLLARDMAKLGPDDGDAREEYQSLYRETMVRAGRSAEAYRRTPTAETFADLAPRARYRDPNGLAALIKAREADDPLDPWLNYEIGLAFVERKDHEQAAASFARGLEAAKDPRGKRTLRRSRIDALCALGRWREAYSESAVAGDEDGKTETDEVGWAFEQVGAYLRGAKQADALIGLIDLRAKSVPSDLGLVCWRADALSLRGDHAGALKVLETSRAALLAHDELRYRFNQTILRELVALRRFGDATVEAKRAGDGEVNPYDKLLIAAAKGDAPAAIAATAACLEDEWDLYDLYADEDLAPYLATDAMLPWRTKYPRPKDEE
jgi:tetratricopeptide (TPR) repeat protein